MMEEENLVLGNALEATPAIHPGGGASRVKHSESASTDINEIVRRHISSGVPIFPDRRANYGDFSDFDSFHAAMDRLMDAQEQFDQLPAEVRDLARNDLGTFLDMVHDEQGLEALKEAGLDASGVPESAEEAPAEGEVASSSSSPPGGTV